MRPRSNPSRNTPVALSEYRIERSAPLHGGLLPPQSLREHYPNRSLAVAVAIKSVKDPTREQVRVVHVPTGEVVFQTGAAEPR